MPDQTTTEAAAAPVDLDGTAASWLNALRHADEQIATWTGIRGRAIEHLQAAIGDAHEARVDGRPVITWKPSKPGRRLDRDALERDFGAATIAAYLVEAKPARPFKVLTPDAD